MVAEGKADEHGHVVQPEFAYHVLSVGLHSAWGDVEIGGDFLGGEAIHHELQYLVFPGSQELGEGIAGFGEDKFGLMAGADSRKVRTAPVTAPASSRSGAAPIDLIANKRVSRRGIFPLRFRGSCRLEPCFDGEVAPEIVQSAGGLDEGVLKARFEVAVNVTNGNRRP